MLANMASKKKNKQSASVSVCVCCMAKKYLHVCYQDISKQSALGVFLCKNFSNTQKLETATKRFRAFNLYRQKFSVYCCY